MSLQHDGRTWINGTNENGGAFSIKVGGRVGLEDRANSNRIQTWPITHFDGESWLVTSRARFEASYFGIEPGNVVKPLSRPTVLQPSSCYLHFPT